jgi:hypothetical protein
VPARSRRPRLLALLAPAVLIALAAHTALWGAWAPSDGAHAYFGWYAPLVTAGGAAGLLGLLLLVAVAALGRRVPRAAALVRRVLPAPRDQGLRLRAFQLAAGALGWLVAQESIERTLQEGRVSLLALDARDLLLVLLATGAGALLVALAERGSGRLARALLAGRDLPPARRAAVRLARPRMVARRPLSPLACSLARRGPPLLVG